MYLSLIICWPISGQKWISGCFHVEFLMLQKYKFPSAIQSSLLFGQPIAMPSRLKKNLNRNKFVPGWKGKRDRQDMTKLIRQPNDNVANNNISNINNINKMIIFINTSNMTNTYYVSYWIYQTIVPCYTYESNYFVWNNVIIRCQCSLIIQLNCHHNMVPIPCFFLTATKPFHISKSF